MARVKISRELALKAFVTSLMETFVDAKTYTRSNVEQIGKTNPIGQTMFASQGQGYGKMTRIGQGQYMIPDAWMTGKSPWEGVSEVVPVATTKPPMEPEATESAPKTKKVKAAKKAEVEEVEVAERITSSVKKNIQKATSKKELFEKAKEVLAKKKQKAVAAETE